MKFSFKQKVRKTPREESFIRLLKSTAIMGLGASTKFLPADANEICDRINLLLQEKQAGNNSNTIDEEIIARADKLLKYKNVSKKQHTFYYINV